MTHIKNTNIYYITERWILFLSLTAAAGATQTFERSMTKIINDPFSLSDNEHARPHRAELHFFFFIPHDRRGAQCGEKQRLLSP